MVICFRNWIVLIDRVWPFFLLNPASLRNLLYIRASVFGMRKKKREEVQYFLKYQLSSSHINFHHKFVKNSNRNRYCSPSKVYSQFFWKTSVQEKKLLTFNLQKLDSPGWGKKEIQLPIPPCVDRVFEFRITTTTATGLLHLLPHSYSSFL